MAPLDLDRSSNLLRFPERFSFVYGPNGGNGRGGCRVSWKWRRSSLLRLADSWNAKLSGWMERMTRAEFIGQPGYLISWINHDSHGVIRSRRWIRGFSLSFCHAKEGNSRGEFDPPPAPLAKGTSGLVFWGFDERVDLFSHPFGVERFKRNGQVERGGSKKLGCDDHRRTRWSQLLPLKTMIIDGSGDRRGCKWGNIIRTMLDVWKNRGNRIYSEIDPDESLGCPLRKIYLGQTKGGGKRNLAVKGGKQ